MAQYRIYPVFLGMKDINEKSVFTYRTDFGVKIPAAYMVYLISGEGRNILVDSGAPRPEDAAKLSFPLLSDARALDAELAKLGVACSDVESASFSQINSCLSAVRLFSCSRRVGDFPVSRYCSCRWARK